ncbi:MAG: hypothetical protein ACRD9W_06020, partial [Terriglobia bacterium]
DLAWSGRLVLSLGIMLALFALLGARRYRTPGLLRKALLGLLVSVAVGVLTFVAVHKVLEEWRYWDQEHKGEA